MSNSSEACRIGRMLESLAGETGRIGHRIEAIGERLSASDLALSHASDLQAFDLLTQLVRAQAGLLDALRIELREGEAGEIEAAIAAIPDQGFRQRVTRALSGQSGEDRDPPDEAEDVTFF